MAGEGDILSQAKAEADAIAATGSPKGDIKVWVSNSDRDFVGPLPVGAPRPKAKVEVDASKLVGLMQKWYANGDANYTKTAQNLVSAGILHPTVANYAPSVLEKTAEAISLWASSDRSMPFGEWLDKKAQSNADEEAKKRSGSGGGYYRGPVTTTAYSVTDKMTAESLLNKMAADLLGRNLTADEVAKYTRDLNKAEAANPQISTQDNQGPQQSSVGTTAPSKEELARRIIQSNDDYPDAAVDAKVIDMFAKSIKEGQATIHG